MANIIPVHTYQHLIVLYLLPARACLSLFIHFKSLRSEVNSFTTFSVPTLAFSSLVSPSSVSQDVVWAVWKVLRSWLLAGEAHGERWWRVSGRRIKKSGNFLLGSCCEVTSGWLCPLTKACCFSTGVHPSLLAFEWTLERTLSLSWGGNSSCCS